ncbi:MAG TPA: T9SS type A sorting domain-containing protein [bacterium]|nr:T9SS type A sorting domain-containing protein [bacterium]
MTRSTLRAGIAAMLCLVAHPAFALSDLVSNWIAPGWSMPALPRSLADGTPTNVPLQSPALPGNFSSTYWNATVKNMSGTDATTAFNHGIYRDDVLQVTPGPSLLLPNGYAFYLNLAPTFVKGGRHTLLSRADVFGSVGESNESNNDWSRQFIWSGLDIFASEPVTRSYDPPSMSPGFGPYSNSEGFQAYTSGPSFWNVFAVIPQDPSTDFDINLCTETPMNIPQQGFGASVTLSSHVGPYTDLVVIDRNLVPGGTYYTSVTNWYGTANKVVEFDSDQGLISNPGVTSSFDLTAGEIVDMHEVYLNAGQPTRIQLHRLSGDANVFLGLFKSPSGYSGSFDALVSASTDGQGAGNDVFVDYISPNGDFYGIVVAKSSAQSLGKPLQYSVTVSQLPNITRYTPAGWFGPVVPRATLDTTFEYAPLPPTLPGNSPATYMNWAEINQGPDAVLNHWTGLWLDDVLTGVGNTSGMLPEGQPYWWSDGQARVVRGGRHHVRSTVDFYDDVLEFPETDNEFTDWFVWTPLELATPMTVLRPPPPVLYPVGCGPWESSDGFRSPGFLGGFWTAIGVVATDMTSDYDVRIHPPSTGSKDGFGSRLAWSADGPGTPDFCLVNFNVVPPGPFDASVVYFGGTADFYIQRADATYWGEVPIGTTSHFGPYTVDPQECLETLEFRFEAGVPYYLSVNNVSGGVDLAMYLFDGHVPYHGKDSYLANANANGPGGDEHIGPITFENGGYYAIVVTKDKASDVNNTATFEIVFSTGQSVVDAPAVSTAPATFALSAPRPNPFAGKAMIELAVPQGKGKAEVGIFDLQGRRIAELANESNPGRHTLTWDGCDSTGREVAAGVYFVRLEAAGVHETKKITLLR